ncbi:hypothetical protein QUF90_17885 [Desulfococcaceae bacterium HSG9]|nr:hypothetical protein [Desulfococcaceae bacterium HSG9]
MTIRFVHIRTYPYCFLCVLFFIFALFNAAPTAAAEESSADPDKLAVIELIEDVLAQSFTIRQVDDTPNFGTLDIIYPLWHKGEPAEARRRWTFHGYLTYAAKYTVHTVYSEQPGIMKAEGKKRITLARLLTFWIFPPEIKWNKFELGFTIKCRRKQSGEWIIITETNS